MHQDIQNLQSKIKGLEQVLTTSPKTTGALSLNDIDANIKMPLSMENIDFQAKRRDLETKNAPTYEVQFYQDELLSNWSKSSKAD